MNGLRFRLFVVKPQVAYTGLVSSDPSDPYMTIAVSSGATGTVGAPLPGNTVCFGTSPGASDVGQLRLRSWTSGNATGTSSVLSVAESDDVGPNIQSGQYVTVYQDWRLWPIYPNILQRGPTEFEYFEDYNVSWNGHTREWRPVAVPGPAAVQPMTGASGTVSFVDGSFALAHGASISSWAWSSPTSVEKTQSGQGTQADPIQFSYTTPGQHFVKLTVTDSNGNTHSSYTWALVYDVNSPDDVGYSDFDGYSDNADRSGGGGQASFTVRGGATIADFPHEAMVIVSYEGELTTPTATWPERDNILFIGYVKQGSVRQRPGANEVSFQAVTIDGLMRNTSMYPMRLDDSQGPNSWVLGYRLTADRIASMLWHYRSTLASMCPIVPSNDNTPIPGQDFGPRDLWTSLADELLRSLWRTPVVNHQGVLYMERDYNLMTTTERAAVSTGKLLHKGVWVDDLDIREMEAWSQPTNVFKMSGVRYVWGQAEAKAYFSEAPGDAVKNWGKEGNWDRLLLTTQADLNTRCGYALARANQHYPAVRMQFVNDGSFGLAPQVVFPGTIEATDNDRGLVWAPELIPASISRSFDNRNGALRVSVEFEPSTTGPAGETVLMPDNPVPDDGYRMPEWDAMPLPIYVPPAAPVPGTAAAALYGSGFFWTWNSGGAWEERNAGLTSDGATGTNQLYFLDVIWDPWWNVKQGSYNPAQSILLGCGPGFIVRSENAGMSWMDVTPLDAEVPNPWGLDPAPTTADITIKQLHGDIHNQGTFFALADYHDGANVYGWLGKTEDDFATFTWYGTNGVVVDDDGWIYPSVMKAWYGYQTPWSDPDNHFVCTSGQGSAVGEADSGHLVMTYKSESLAAKSNYLTGLFFDFGAVITGEKQVWFKAYKTGTLTDYFASQRWTASESLWNTAIATGAVTGWSGFTSPWYSQGWLSPAGSSSAWYQVLLTRDNCDLRYFAVENVPRGGVWVLGSQYFLDTIRATGSFTQPEVRPIAMDVDTQDGSRLYLTVLNDDVVQLWTYSTSTMTRVGIMNLGDATNEGLDDGTFGAVPRTPHFPEVADFGDIVWVFGRWTESGTAVHIRKSTDGGLSSVVVSDAAWTTERVSAFDQWGNGDELYAFLAAGSPALHRTTDGGTSWLKINDLPFSCEFEAMYRFYGGNTAFIIGSNAEGAQMAAWQAYPYQGVWNNATGAVLPTAGGPITAIVWV